MSHLCWIADVPQDDVVVAVHHCQLRHAAAEGAAHSRREQVRSHLTCPTAATSQVMQPVHPRMVRHDESEMACCALQASVRQQDGEHKATHLLPGGLLTHGPWEAAVAGCPGKPGCGKQTRAQCPLHSRPPPGSCTHPAHKRCPPASIPQPTPGVTYDPSRSQKAAAAGMVCVQGYGHHCCSLQGLVWSTRCSKCHP